MHNVLADQIEKNGKAVKGLTPWLLYAYIYVQSEKAFSPQCKQSIVLRHVFSKSEQ